MIGWSEFPYFASVTALVALVGAVAATRERTRRMATVALWLATAVMGLFIVLLWIGLERPPMRTMGETRLWYTFFLSLAGVAVYARWRYKWVLSFSTLMSVVFICINLFKPEIHNKSLMPALQSVWFVPHVIVYMFAYAMMGAVTLFALYLWLRKREAEATESVSGSTLPLDSLRL